MSVCGTKENLRDVGKRKWKEEIHVNVVSTIVINLDVTVITGSENLDLPIGDTLETPT